MMIHNVEEMVKHRMIMDGDQVVFNTDDGAEGSPWTITVMEKDPRTLRLVLSDKGGSRRRAGYLVDVLCGGDGSGGQIRAKDVLSPFYKYGLDNVVEQDDGQLDVIATSEGCGRKFTDTTNALIAMLTLADQITAGCKEVEVEGNMVCLDKLKKLVEQAEEDC